jgi:hypothetical protein
MNIKKGGTNPNQTNKLQKKEYRLKLLNNNMRIKLRVGPAKLYTSVNLAQNENSWLKIS